MSEMAVSLASSPPSVLPGDLSLVEHTLTVPLDYAAPASGTTSLFVREMCMASKRSDEKLPFLLYLQGGPGFPAGRPSVPPSGWQKAALEKYRVLLLDQRGTGRSAAVTTESLAAYANPEDQADFLSHFRADSIVRDCELIRTHIAGGQQLTLLGQSFGGFCILSYLSLAPAGVERALFTFGLAPVGCSAEDVYRATFKRMEYRNKRYYTRYPADVDLVRRIVSLLHASAAQLPRGGTLTPRRFLQLGLLLGSASGLEALHDLLELARSPTGEVDSLPQHFLLAVEQAQQHFETNPIYWLLHEAIYCDGPGTASCWAAERVQASLGEAWDYTCCLSPTSPPIQFTGEMVYSWMGEDYAWLRPLQQAAEILAQKDDWGRLYDEQALRAGVSPCAALISYDDIYVERACSEATVEMLGGFPRVRTWVSNEFQHSGLRDQPSVFEKLLAMSKGELEH
eukprot:CAMPEP_0183340042 /NCGR_PEP_ID=MMETSP0164_2-20130417/6731_1 /TAXON_ID=221442 /ORGANISM="Coccolithus pelagicus ssp braarudi, Strain PLY182g" /LENGTH=453 /DNA_ID=CAMNT_0025510117 /DNA_START=95 /DNA_END=1456 /DNA_ORIENTATION=+